MTDIQPMRTAKKRWPWPRLGLLLRGGLTKFGQLLRARWLLILLALVMLNNVEHVAYTHHQVSQQLFPAEWMNWLHSALVTVVIEGMIIFLEVRRYQWPARAFTVVLFYNSLVYYDVRTMYHAGQWLELGTVVTLQGLFTTAIAILAHVLGQDLNRGSLAADLQQLQETLQQQEKDLQARAAKLEEKERKVLQGAATGLQPLQDLQQREQALQQKEKDLQQRAAKLQETEHRLQQRAASVPQADLQDLQHLLENVQPPQHLQHLMQLLKEWTVCPTCSQVFPSPGSLRSHKSKCTNKE